MPSAVASDVARALAVLLESGSDAFNAATLLAQSATGSARRQLIRLAEPLAKGESLAAAMSQVPALFTDDDATAVAEVASSGPAVVATLRSIGDRLAHRAEARAQWSRGLVYPGLVVASYVLLAPATLLVTDSVAAFAAAAACNLGWLAIAVVGAGGALAGALRHRALRGALDRATWWLPRLAAPWIHHRRAVYCSALARAIGEGLPSSLALRNAALISGDLALQHWLGTVGSKPPPALGLVRTLTRCGLVHRADGLAAVAAEHAESLPDALRVLVRRSAKRRRGSTKVATLLLGATLTIAVMAQAAVGVIDAYQSFPMGAAAQLPELGPLDLELGDVTMPGLP